MEVQFSDFLPDEPCWNLVVIAADPARASRGYGTRLLEYGLRICDEDRKPVYLESLSQANMRLYQRFGFEVIGEFQAGSSHSVFPMMREPRRHSKC